MVNDVHRQSFHFDTEDTPDTTLQSTVVQADWMVDFDSKHTRKKEA